VALPLPPALPRQRQWLHTLFWAGLRSALSLAVVLGLPADLPARHLLLNLTFGVVLFTLLVQGLTMEPLLRRLRLVGADQQHTAYLARRAKLLMQRAALRELRRLKNDAVLSRRVLSQLETAYQAVGEELGDQLEGLYQDQSALGMVQIWVKLLDSLAAHGCRK
jgi:CPA1 family monovalent cation:H+ antiporter